jgi:thioredoxin-dependent peroxiredoxin
MNELPVRAGVVAARGRPLTLEGRPVRVGDAAPDFVVVGNDMSEVRLSEFRGRAVVVSTVPSLDTSLCDLETRTFNEKAAALGENVVVLTISMDLPFAQRRWCGDKGVERVVTLSDYKHRDVGRNWGLRIVENGLLTRAVYVVDPRGIITHEQLLPDTSMEPDYDAALTAAREAAGV